MKKTLHITSRPGGDWGQDLIHAGLVKRLGPESVIEYPFWDKYRERHDAFTGDREHDWGLERRTVGWTPDSVKMGVYDELTIIGMIRRGEIERIFIDERPESYELYLRLKANFFQIPVVVVAGHDSFQSKLPPWEVVRLFGKNFEHMFLDNWTPLYDQLPKTSVYNWSINFDHYWNRPPRNKYDALVYEKKYDISFMGYNSHPDRARFVDHITRNWGHLRLKLDLEREPNTMRSFVRKSDYFDVMSQSEICLNLRGAADNGKTLRFYEIPYVGSLMLSQDSGAVQVRPFKDKCHCLYFKDESELDHMIDDMLKPGMEPIRRQLAEQGHRHAMEYHTVDARIRQIYEVLDGQG